MEAGSSNDIGDAAWMQQGKTAHDAHNMFTQSKLWRPMQDLSCETARKAKS